LRVQIKIGEQQVAEQRGLRDKQCNQAVPADRAFAGAADRQRDIDSDGVAHAGLGSVWSAAGRRCNIDADGHIQHTSDAAHASVIAAASHHACSSRPTSAAVRHSARQNGE
jgi:hypothetical protein